MNVELLQSSHPIPESGAQFHVQVAGACAEEITVVHGVSREPVKMARAGDIVSVSVTGFTPRWTQTLVSHPKMPPVECQPIDPPVISVRAAVNDSPLAGKDGKYITLNAMGERLEKEALTNPAIDAEVNLSFLLSALATFAGFYAGKLQRAALLNFLPSVKEIQQSANRDYFEIRGRGEMQLGILVEEMRREGYEMSLSPPSVVMQERSSSQRKRFIWSLKIQTVCSTPMPLDSLVIQARMESSWNPGRMCRLRRGGQPRNKSCSGMLPCFPGGHVTRKHGYGTHLGLFYMTLAHTMWQPGKACLGGVRKLST